MLNIALRMGGALLATASLTSCQAPTAWRDVLPFNWYETTSTAMEPTLTNGSKFMAHSIAIDEVQRGDVLMVTTKNGDEYVKRLIGLPGDTVELRAGALFLNGEQADQTVVSDFSYRDSTTDITIDAYRIREQLPGSNRTHFILDERETPHDDYGPITLPNDRYFFLGDNRDNSADSRAQGDHFGLGIVTGSQITRKVDLTSIEQ